MEEWGNERDAEFISEGEVFHPTLFRTTPPSFDYEIRFKGKVPPVGKEVSGTFVWMSSIEGVLAGPGSEELVYRFEASVCFIVNEVDSDNAARITFTSIGYPEGTPELIATDELAGSSLT